MGEVKRYEAVNLRYDDNNIRYGDRCGVEVVLASDYATLEAENAKLKGEYEWVASINTALDESNQSAWAENAKLRAELERRAVPDDHTEQALAMVPDEPTPEMVSAAEEAYMPFGDMDIALRMAILSALSAPATAQGGVYSTDPLACSGCVSGCFRCRSVKVQGDGWIPVSERLPESERTVLAFYLNSHGKGRRVRAEYIAAKTKSADDGWDSDEPADYDEQADEYFWPADWYEVMDNWDDLTHMVIHEGEVTHWMPLPAAPGAAPSAPKADDPVKQMLLEALEKVDSEHEILGWMKTCELRRERGSFGIAVMSDELALDWQSHQKNLERLIGLRLAAIAAARKEGKV